jgi:formate dehydrogenase subunit delta
MSSPDRLVHMANQIGRFFAVQPGEAAPSHIAEHLCKFWDPRMRAGILAHLAAGGAGLDPLVREAVEHLREDTRRN